MADEVLRERRGNIEILTINRPEARNAMSGEVMALLHAGAAEARADPEVRVLVLTGAGDKAFCAGADLVKISQGAMGPSFLQAHDDRGHLAGLMEELWLLGKPTIARVRGYALAGGFGLALSCDLVIAADDAVFGAPEIDVGLWPYMVTVPLMRSMPPKKALELMLTGRRVGADEAARIGFVNQVVPATELDVAVDAMAAVLAAKPPDTLRLGRDSFYRVWDMAARDALPLLHALLTVTVETDEAKEGTTAFAEKRAPWWRAAPES
jgi:enoyl-CoA hydratase/carnithine racemase